MIQLPPKIWRPNPENKYIPVNYSNDIDEGVFNFSHHGKTVYCPKEKWSDSDRDDVILFDHDNDIKELMDNLHIGDTVEQKYKDDIIHIIKDCWDCFCARGVCRAILDYEFAINTGASKPVCCHWPAYYPDEKKYYHRADTFSFKKILDRGIQWFLGQYDRPRY